MYIGSAELHEKLRDKITSYEQRSGCMVYAVCKDYLYGCRFISLLFVSPYEEDWQWDITTHGNKHRVYAYVHNLDAEELSESGSVLLECNDGCIKRIITRSDESLGIETKRQEHCRHREYRNKIMRKARRRREV